MSRRRGLTPSRGKYFAASPSQFAGCALDMEPVRGWSRPPKEGSGDESVAKTRIRQPRPVSRERTLVALAQRSPPLGRRRSRPSRPGDGEACRSPPSASRCYAAGGTCSRPGSVQDAAAVSVRRRRRRQVAVMVTMFPERRLRRECVAVKSVPTRSPPALLSRLSMCVGFGEGRGGQQRSAHPGLTGGRDRVLRPRRLQFPAGVRSEVLRLHLSADGDLVCVHGTCTTRGVLDR